MPIGTNVAPINGLDPQVLAQILQGNQSVVDDTLKGAPNATLQGMYQARDDNKAVTDKYLEDVQLRRLLQMGQNRDLMAAQQRDEEDKNDLAGISHGLITKRYSDRNSMPDIGDAERLQSERNVAREKGAKNFQAVASGIKDDVEAGNSAATRGRSQKDLEQVGAGETELDLSTIPSLRAANRQAEAVENAAKETNQNTKKNLQMVKGADGVLRPTEVTDVVGHETSTKTSSKAQGKAPPTTKSSGVDANAEVNALAAQFSASPVGKSMKLTKVVPDGEGGGYFHTDKGVIHVPASKAK